MVGSANVTAGGLLRNEELSHAVSGNTADPLHDHYLAYLKKLSELVAE